MRKYHRFFKIVLCLNFANLFELLYIIGVKQVRQLFLNSTLTVRFRQNRPCLFFDQRNHTGNFLSLGKNIIEVYGRESINGVHSRCEHSCVAVSGVVDRRVYIRARLDLPRTVVPTNGVRAGDHRCHRGGVLFASRRAYRETQVCVSVSRVSFRINCRWFDWRLRRLTWRSGAPCRVIIPTSGLLQ